MPSVRASNIEQHHVRAAPLAQLARDCAFSARSTWGPRAEISESSSLMPTSSSRPDLFHAPAYARPLPRDIAAASGEDSHRAPAAAGFRSRSCRDAVDDLLHVATPPGAARPGGWRRFNTRASFAREPSPLSETPGRPVRPPALCDFDGRHVARSRAASSAPCVLHQVWIPGESARRRRAPARGRCEPAPHRNREFRSDSTSPTHALRSAASCARQARIVPEVVDSSLTRQPFSRLFRAARETSASSAPAWRKLGLQRSAESWIGVSGFLFHAHAARHFRQRWHSRRIIADSSNTSTYPPPDAAAARSPRSTSAGTAALVLELPVAPRHGR